MSEQNQNLEPLDFSAEMQKYVKRNKRKKIGWGIASPFIATLLIILIAMMTAAAPRVDPVTSYNGDNKYITFASESGCMLSAHRAGGVLAPENTLAAMENCLNVDYTIDVLEFDLHLTKDGELILLHDETLNRTSDATQKFGTEEAKPINYTLAQIKTLNMAANFQNTAGEYPYRGMDEDDLPDNVRIATLNEVLDYTETTCPDGSLDYIIEIKDGDDVGRTATDKLYEILTTRNMLDRVVVGTFQGEITKYMDEKYPDFTRSSSIAEVLDFYFCYLFNIDLSKKKLGYEVMQIPYKLYGFNFGHKSIIDYAHHYGLAVQYWTINEAEDIRLLVERGADCIMTDNPELANQIFKELKA